MVINYTLMEKQLTKLRKFKEEGKLDKNIKNNHKLFSFLDFCIIPFIKMNIKKITFLKKLALTVDNC